MVSVMPRPALFLLAAASLAAAPKKPVPTGLPPPEPYRPSEGGSLPLSTFKVPEGLEVTLWARSPMLANPTNIDFDAQGRLWVNEGVNYRVYNKGGKRRPEGDRVVVLSDTKGAGVADTGQTFVQDPSCTSPLGLAVIDNVIYVSHAPTIHKFTDVNRDGKFDPAVDRREEFLTGFGGQDHDHSLHALVTGPDGKRGAQAIFQQERLRFFLDKAAHRAGAEQPAFAVNRRFSCCLAHFHASGQFA